jgi:hypothetical protein
MKDEGWNRFALSFVIVILLGFADSKKMAGS